MKGSFVEIGHYNEPKNGERVEGDVFLSRKSPDEGRIITVLSDGLGSGVKANVLATLTATMAAGCAASNVPIQRTASVIMRSLPVCSERRISYATFTLVDVEDSGKLSVVEYDNPAYVLVREKTLVEPIKTEIAVKRGRRSGGLGERAILRWSSFAAKPGDRLVVFSDGVTQAGMGMRASPLGWGGPAVEDFVLGAVRGDPGVSARDLARTVVREALSRDMGAARDDITCGVVYFRDARRLLVLTGPPLYPERDVEMARVFREHPG
ncbi:MAG: SpoIIE family protein phosphatase, partial [Spirochaetaceae bacterium]|nr:SpoIIE family protein phosphatase [Spirochaetaceae bacterium]